jgi:hypothetical protein
MNGLSPYAVGPRVSGAAMKPDKPGAQRLRSTIFPFVPKPNSSRDKIAALHRPLLTLQPARSSRVLARPADFLGAAPERPTA